jgi:ketosteroid isomerase-like protein
MQPKEIVLKWIAAFNRADVNSLGDLYAENAINHQVVNEPVVGQRAIKKMFEQEF